MQQKAFFPPRPDADPKIYAYSLEGVPEKKGWIKVGYTIKSARERVAEQLGTSGLHYTILFERPAMRNDGSVFMDHEVHRVLEKKGFTKDQEWFRCSLRDVQTAYHTVVTREENEENRHQTFRLRPEQAEAVEKTAQYFRSNTTAQQGKPSHFLWNAKMRFGKTFATYKLAQKMGWRRVLVLTFKPAVENSWEEDLMSHADFEGWQFFNSKPDEGLTFDTVDKTRPFVCFGSFQDYLGKKDGKTKEKNKWVHEENWDCVVFDEYHYGAWREGVKELFEGEETKVQDGVSDTMEFSEDALPIRTGAYLYLSGTPFRAIQSGEFIEEQIYNWTYSDEQRAKEKWDDAHGPNPYASLPRMVMMTYQLPDIIREIAMDGEFNEFDLNTFFEAKGKEENARFVYEDEVQKWLNLIRGAFQETTVDDLKLGARKPPMPFSHGALLSVLNHTLWFLPSVSSCYAMANLLKKRNNVFYKDYTVVVASGTKAGQGAQALKPVQVAMDDPLSSKTITLSCGKLMTGVSVKPWTGIFMLKNLSTPETYFQAAFRVQTPWTVKNPDSMSPNKEEILKQECYVFDFAPNRALRQIADYSCRLNVGEKNPEKNVEEFIHFLPVLAYDGSAMRQIDAAGILDMAMSGTTATLLARRWESALLVNVDNNTLKRLMENPDAMRALAGIEGFRSLNQDIETIVNKSEQLDKKKKEQAEKEEELTEKEKKDLSEEEKEIKGKRKQIQEKLIKFATRVPVFMYLTDFREHTLKDVITELEPGLFKKVTGLTKTDFELLVSLGVFNSALMNDAVYKFKRYEDASLSYTGINRHVGEDVGGFDTTISEEEFLVRDSGKETYPIFVNDSSVEE
jgi:hypothetical protein